MDILSLSNEEIETLLKNRKILEKEVLNTQGLILNVLDNRNIKYDINLLFANNEVVINILLDNLLFFKNKINDFNLESLKVIAPLIALKDTTSTSGELSVFVLDIFKKLDENNVEIEPVENIKVFSMIDGKRKKVKLKQTIFFNPLEKLKQLEKESFESNTKKVNDEEIESPYVNYSSDYYYEEEKEIRPLEDIIENNFNKHKFSKLIKPYSSKYLKELKQLLSEVKRNQRDFDDLINEIKEVVIENEVVNKFWLKLKEGALNPTNNKIIEELFVSIVNYENYELDGMKYLFNNEQSISLLKNEDFINDCGKKLAQLAIYKSLKYKESVFYEAIERINSGVAEDPCKDVLIEQVQEVMSDNDDYGLIDRHKINKLLEDMIEIEDLSEDSIAEYILKFNKDLMNMGQDIIQSEKNSQAFREWEEDFSKYASYIIKNKILSCVDVSRLSKTDLDFIKEQTKQSQEEPIKIMRKRELSPVVVGYENLPFTPAAFNVGNTIFNNDKNLDLKDIFIKTIDNPIYFVSNDIYEKNIRVLRKYDKTNIEKRVMHEPVKASFKYLTQEQALQLGYQERLYIPEKDSSRYSLSEEKKRVMQYSLEDWKTILKVNKNNTVKESADSVNERIKLISKLTNIKTNDILDDDLAYMVIKEFFEINNANKDVRNDIDNYEEGLIEEYSKTSNLHFYTKGTLFTDVAQYKKTKNKILKHHNQENKNLLKIFKRLNDDDFSFANDDNVDFDFYIDKQNDESFLLSLNILLEKYKNHAEKKKFLLNIGKRFFVEMGGNLYRSDSYEKFHSSNAYVQFLVLGKYLLENGTIEGKNIKYISNALLYADSNLSNTIESAINMKNPVTIEDKAIIFFKDLFEELFLHNFIPKGAQQIHINKILENALKQKKLYSNENQNQNNLITDKTKKNILQEIVNNFDDEIAIDIIYNTNIVENIYNNFYYKSNMIKSLFQEKYKQAYDTIKIGENSLNDVIENGVPFSFVNVWVNSINNDVKDLKQSLNDFVEQKRIDFKDPIESARKDLNSYVEKSVSDHKSFDIHMNSEILGLLDLNSEDKKLILVNNTKELSKYTFLANQEDKKKFILPFPYDELLNKYKESLDTALKVTEFVYKELEELGWEKEDIIELDYNTLRLNLYRRKIKDENKKEQLETILKKAFNKYYTKEKLMNNALLRAPLNNSNIRFILNDIKYSPEHSTYQKQLSELIYSYLNNLSFEKMAVLKEISIHNYALNLEKSYVLNMSEEMLNTLLMYGEKISFVPEKMWDKINLSKITDIAIKENKPDKIENLLSLVNNVNIEMLFNEETKKNHLLLNHLIDELKEFNSNLNETKKTQLLNLFQQVFDTENHVLKTNEEPMLNASNLDDCINILSNYNFKNLSYKSWNPLKDFFKQNTLVQRNKRVQEILDNENIIKIIRDYLKNPEKAKVNTFEDLFFVYSKKTEFTLEQRLKWLDRIDDLFVFEGNENKDKEKYSAFIRLLALSESKDYLITDEMLEKTIKIYNEAKKLSPEKYLLTHLTVYEDLVANLGRKYMENYKDKHIFNGYEDELPKAIGTILSLELIDVEKIKTYLDNNFYNNKSTYSLMVYSLFGSIGYEHYKGITEQSVGDFSRRIRGVREIEDFDAEMKQKINKFINYSFEKGGINILGYDNIFGYKPIELESIDENINKLVAKQSLVSILWPNKYFGFVDSDDYYKSSSYNKIFKQKMEKNHNDDICELIDLVEFIQNKRKKYEFNIDTSFMSIVPLQDNDLIERHKKLFLTIENHTLFNDLKAYQRMSILNNNLKEKDVKIKTKKSKL